MHDEHDSPNDDVLGDVFSSDRDRAGTDAPAAESGRQRDELGRFAPAQPAEQQPEATAQPEQPASAEQPAETPEDPNASRHVPLSEMLAERKKFQERLAEAEQYKQRAAYLEQMMAQMQQPQRQQQQEPPPDIFEDPDRYLETRLAPLQNQFQNMFLNMSEMMARRDPQWGDKVDEAVQMAQQLGINRQFASQPDPYGALMDWYKQQSVLKEVGTDPQAYRQRIEQEVRQKVLEEMKAGRAPGGNQPPRFPTSLADQTNAGGQTGAHLSDEAVMAQLFNPDRGARG